MITANGTYFPYNAIDVLVQKLQPIDSDLVILRRPLRDSDPVQCLGIFSTLWVPDPESFEMRGHPVSVSEPTLARYIISIQGLVKDTDEERGAATHATFAKIVRSMLYRDNSLRVALRALTANAAGSDERTQRFGIGTQRYLSNEISGSWFYLFHIEFWLETETS